MSEQAREKASEQERERERERERECQAKFLYVHDQLLLLHKFICMIAKKHNKRDSTTYSNLLALRYKCPSSPRPNPRPQNTYSCTLVHTHMMHVQH